MSGRASGLPDLLHYEVLRICPIKSPLQQTTHAQPNGPVSVTVRSKTILRMKLIENFESKGTAGGNGVELWLVRIRTIFQGLRLDRLAACTK